jgi:ABC-type taurine transport system substrate-binding protein
MKERLNEIDWSQFPLGESIVSDLAKRDEIIAEIAQVPQLKSRITQLEQEILQLRQMERVWLGNRLSKLYYLIPRTILGFFVKKS